jgi:tRNA (pseudouridine54-N1)-methyltransferase
MRQFLIIGHDAPTTPDFELDNLTGAGRLDALCRCVTAAFLLSHDIREDVRVRVVLADEYTLRFEGEELRRLNPDERSTAALFRTALEQRGEAIGHMAVETSPGVYLSRRNTEAAIGDAADEGTVVQLHEDGDPANEVTLPATPVFVLSDHRDFSDDETRLIDDQADQRIRLGPRRLHGNQTITVAHNWLDTEGWTVC